MEIKRMPLGCYGANSYIISDKTRECIIVDPGGEAEDIIAFIEKNELKPQFIVLTHGHGDHIGGVEDLKEKYDLKLYVHEADEELVNDPEKNLSSLLPMKEVSLKVDKKLRDGDILEFGDQRVEVIHTPGHSPGCICLKIREDILTGDTLFRGSIGRTDLYGSTGEIVDSIKNKIMIYSDSTTLHPGHGPESTIEFEKANNPFICTS